jgi:hypothetical protein
MKLVYKISHAAILGVAVCLGACEDPEYTKPNTEVESANLSANFLLANASPDAPALDLYINKCKRGNSTIRIYQCSYFFEWCNC